LHNVTVIHLGIVPNKTVKINLMKKSKLLLVLALLTGFSVSAQKILVSSVYDGEKVKSDNSQTGEVRSYFKSPTKNLETFNIEAITINAGKVGNVLQVEKGTDELMIIKEGVIEIKVNNELKVLGEGSVVLASGGDIIKVSNKQNTNAVYYSISFKPRTPDKQKQPEVKTSPLFFDWNTIVFKPNTNGGGRRDIMRQKTSTLKELEIHVTTLKEGISSHAGHSHPDEEFVLMRYGNADMDLDGTHYKGGAGSIFFLAAGGVHSLSNVGTGPCEYFAIRWLTE
jgi:(S)-ureidoglycine aminohydrolase